MYYNIKIINRIIILFILAGSFSSCSILKPSIMLKTGRNYSFSKPDSLPRYEYKIAPNDILSFKMFSNDGFKLIDMATIGGISNIQARSAGISYLVEHDGLVKLPILGRIKIDGLTIREAELMLEEKYVTFYNSPFVILKATNRRVIIFPGTGSTARVINLSNTNTTLMEALALAGGISTGKAKRIKLIRGDMRDPKVYLIDLSTIEGMKQANMVIQANDIIYVEPVLALHRALVSEINAYLTLISTVTSIGLLYTLFKQ